MVPYILPERKLTLRDRVASVLRGSSIERKEGLPMQALSGERLDAWWGGTEDAVWEGASFQNFVRLAYKQNSAVFSVIQALATGFAEAPIAVYEKATKEKVSEGVDRTADQIYQLFHNPNPDMGEKEMWLHIMTYTPLGGNGYLYMARSKAGVPVQLWPYHHGKMRPVPMGGDNPESWVASYSYDLGSGNYRYLPKEDVLHFKWMPDPDTPYVGQSPMEPVWREVLSDNELTRFIKALVQNDATPRGVLTTPSGLTLNKQAKQDIKLNWKRMFGGNNAGDVAIMEGGLTYVRLALNMQELQTDLIRKVPEARIAAAFKIHPVIAHLNVGLDKSTYSNYEEARQQFTEETLVPLWDLVASELNQDLMPELDPSGRFYLGFDTTQVESLKENTNQKAQWVIQAYAAGIPTLNQALQSLGWPTVETADGDERHSAPAPVAPLGLPAPTDGAPPDSEMVKAVQRFLETKAKQEETRKKLEAKIQSGVQAHLEDMYKRVAQKIEDAA
jgi:HK97 family phage portal protein